MSEDLLTSDSKLRALSARESDPNSKVVRLIESHFQSVRARRPSYSRRALSRDLKLSSGQLSDILKGKRPLSRTTADRILSRIPIASNMRCRLLERLPTRRVGISGQRALQDREIKKRTAYSQLREAQFRIVSQWHHFAILALVETADFLSDASWISKRLGISEKTVRTSLRDLLSLGLLQKNANGQYFVTGQQFTTVDEIPSGCIRRNHRQGLALAAKALELPVSVRDFSSLTFAIDPQYLPILKRKIFNVLESVRRPFVGKRKTQVYRLGFQFFPLTRSSGSS